MNSQIFCGRSGHPDADGAAGNIGQDILYVGAAMWKAPSPSLTVWLSSMATLLRACPSEMILTGSGPMDR